MTPCTCHRFLSEADPDYADSTDAVVLGSLPNGTVGDAGQESAERLVDSPR